MKLVNVREAQPEDSQAIVDILFRSWCATYIPLGVPEEAIIESFGNLGEKVSIFANYLKKRDHSMSMALVAERDGVVLGMCFLNKIDDSWKLSQFYIDPEHFREGVGSVLIIEVFRTADDDIELSVVANNNRAIAFYSAHGFVPTGEKSVYQSTDEVQLDEIIMQRSGQLGEF